MNAGPADGQAKGGGPVRVGDELRARRLALGWDLGEIAVALRIRLAYLEALERGDLKQMPGNAYALGFLRSYANILGLEPEPICQRFRNESRDINRKTELTFPAPAPERGVPAGAAGLVGLVVIAAVYAGWYHFSSHDSVPAQNVPELPAPPTADGSHPPATPSPAVASVMPDGQAARPPSVLTPPGGEHPPAAVPQAQPPAPAPSASPPAMQALPSPQPVAPAPVTPPPPPAAPPGEVALVAKAETWVQVRRDGHVLYDHTMQAGDRWVLPPGDGQAVMTVGNAGGLAIATGGTEGQVLGHDGAVLRNVKLGNAVVIPESSGGLSPTASSPAVPASGAPTPAPSDATGTNAAAGLPGDFSGSGAAKPRRRPPHPAAASSETSADDLNARQLQQHAAPGQGQ